MENNFTSIVQTTAGSAWLLTPPAEALASTATVATTDDQLRTACATLELTAQLSSANSLHSAAIHFVNSARQYLGCDGMAVAIAKPSGQCQLLAVSDVVDVNRRSTLAEKLENAGRETVSAGHWVYHDPRDSRGLPGHQALGDLLEGAFVGSGVLLNGAGATVGAWISWTRRPLADTCQTKRFAEVAAVPLGSTLQLLVALEQNPLRRALARLPWLRKRWLWAGVAALLLATLWLRPYRIACQCWSEAAHRRFVAAPFAGVVRESLVRPGDVVTADQTLAVMDGRELRIELDALKADFERASKSRDVNLASNKTAAAQIDRMEMERIQQKQLLLESRANNLEVKSPVPGIVMSGDLDRSEGAPVTVGQVLYEIAATDDIVIELAIPDEDVSHAVVGQRVELRFDALARSIYRGTLSKIHPRSETRDSQNVFVAEVAVDGPPAGLRPGMTGNAALVTEAHTVGWILLHKIWRRAAPWLGG